LLGKRGANDQLGVPTRLVTVVETTKSAKILDFARKRSQCSDADGSEREQFEKRALVAARTHPIAVWDLADLYLPIHVRKLYALVFPPKLAAAIWRSAFVAGWQAAERSKPIKDV
jgi:hypothetical protein